MKQLFTVLGLMSLALNAQAQKPLLLDNFNLIDGTAASMQTGKSMLIVEDTIHSIFDHGEAPALTDVEVLDMTGKYILPGLFDAHTHLAGDPSGRDRPELTQARLQRLLKSGVTGVRDMSGDARLLGYLARQAMLDEIESPDIYYSALVAGGRFFQRDRRVAAASRGYERGQAPWMRALGSESDMVKLVAAAKGTGATGLKLYASLPDDLIQRVSKEARAQGMRVWGHAAILPGVPSAMVDAGVEVLSHGVLLALEQLVTPVPGQRPIIDTALTATAPKLEALVASMASKGSVLDATLTVYRGRFPRALYGNGVKATQMAYEAGVSIVVGTDRGIPQEESTTLPLIEEMVAMVQDVGAAPLEVIRMATLNTAMVLGIAEDTGSISVGKKANLLVLDQNPLEDMMHLEGVHLVLKNGRQIKP